MAEDANKPSSELLQPVNLVLSVRRNLAATWYHKMAALEVDGDLKPMEVSPFFFLSVNICSTVSNVIHNFVDLQIVHKDIGQC